MFRFIWSLWLSFWNSHKPIKGRRKRHSPFVLLHVETCETRIVPTAGIMGTLLDPGMTLNAGNDFGRAVATFGNQSIVGSPYAGVNGIGSAGKATLYSNNQPIAILQKPSQVTSWDEFGLSVDINASYVVVGCPSDDTGAPNAGAVFVFTLTGNFVRKISNPAPAANDFFGQVVKLDGNSIFISAPGDNITEKSGRDDAGTIYQFDVATGKLLRTFTAQQPRAGDFFGTSFAVFGKTLLVGAPFANGAATDTGKAYVLNVSTGSQIAVIPGPYSNGNAHFGEKTAIGESGFAAISAPGANSGRGAVDIYSTTNWSRITTLSDPTWTDGGQFGFGLSFMGGTTLLVGSPADIGPNGRTGSLFQFDTISWRPTQEIFGTVPNGFFGGAIAADSKSAIVGAMYERTVGAAYIFVVDTVNVETGLLFDGRNDYVSIPSSSLNSQLSASREITIELWFRLDRVQDGCFIAQAFGQGSANSFALWYQSGHLQGRVGTGANHVSVPWSIDVGGWHHLAMSYNGPAQSLSLYLDGKLIGSTTVVDAPIFDGHSITLGSDFDAGNQVLPLAGAMTSVNVWTRVRSQAEIKLDAVTTYARGTQYLALQLTFDEIGAIVIDTGGAVVGANNGSLGNGSLDKMPQRIRFPKRPTLR